MKLIDYLKLKQVKPLRWADQHGYHRSRVYAWITGQTPTAPFIAKIERDTEGAVRFQDWVE